MQFTQTVAPGAEPLTLVEVKAHLRVSHAEEDALILGLISAARAYIEAITERVLITQTWRGFADCFDESLELLPALQSVSEVRYLDVDGVQQILAASVYSVDPYGLIGTLNRAINQSWPATNRARNNIEIDFIAGYGDAGAVPAPIKQALYLLIGHYYENRESTVVGVSVAELPLGVGMLLTPYAIHRIG